MNFHELVRNGDAEVLRQALVAVDPHQQLDLRSLLIQACQNGRLKIVEALVDYGADINARDVYGWHSLAWANRYADIVEYLICKGVEVDLVDKYDRTTLDWTVNYEWRRNQDNERVIQLLVDGGANVNKFSTKNNHSILEAACKASNFKAMEILIKNGADIYLDESGHSRILEGIEDEDIRKMLYDAYYYNCNNYLLK
jgi:ankyrin repeat protein